MIEAQTFFAAAAEYGIRLYSGVPCSYLKPFINYAISSRAVHYVGAANEGEAVAIASGAELAGVGAAVMFQNSGFGNAVSPLTSLNAIFRIPVLLIITLRGEPGGASDEPQHELMGEITTPLLDLLRIKWEYFPVTDGDVAPCLARARAHFEQTGLPYALVMRKDSVREEVLARGEPVPSIPEPLPHWVTWQSERLPRIEVLRAITSNSGSSDIIIATTGHAGRELYGCGDQANQFYMVGSMGCASSFALGMAIAQPERRVIVIDGDGAALMRLGAWSVIGRERPPNLLHLVLDNEAHESTGAQSTVTGSVDLAQVARACGYPCAIRAQSIGHIASLVAEPLRALTLVHVKTEVATAKNLPRPTIKPRDVAARLRHFLTTSA